MAPTRSRPLPDSIHVLHDLYWPLVHVEPIDYGADLSHVAFIDSTSIAIALTALVLLAAVYAYPTIASHTRIG